MPYENVNTVIAEVLAGMDAMNQRAIDERLLELDGTDNKSNPVQRDSWAWSFPAVARAGSCIGRCTSLGSPRWLRRDDPSGSRKMNIINGAYADNNVDFQEFMIICVHPSSARPVWAQRSSMHSGRSFGRRVWNTAVGDEGGFAPNLGSNREALEVIAQAVANAGYSLGNEILLALDVASSEFYSDGTYNLEGMGVCSAPRDGRLYGELCEAFPSPVSRMV